MDKRIFYLQSLHLFGIVVSFFILFLFCGDVDLTSGEFFGLSSSFWLCLAFLIPVAHQLYVAIIWRLELYTSFFTKRWGLKKAFFLYSIGFSILFGMRLVSIILLAISNKETLGIEPIFAYVLAAFITPFVVYTFYSVKKYFGIKRAYGIDHFDKNYNEPFVKKGIFRYTNNAMYIVGMSVLYLPGLLFLSKAALVAALFNHLYIWVHYFTTELPDIKSIYKTTPKENQTHL